MGNLCCRSQGQPLGVGLSLSQQVLGSGVCDNCFYFLSHLKPFSLVGSHEDIVSDGGVECDTYVHVHVKGELQLSWSIIPFYSLTSLTEPGVSCLTVSQQAQAIFLTLFLTVLGYRCVHPSPVVCVCFETNTVALTGFQFNRIYIGKTLYC